MFDCGPADLILHQHHHRIFPRPRWLRREHVGKALDTCIADVRSAKKIPGPMAVTISDQERAGLDILTHGDLHVDEDLAAARGNHYPLSRWAGLCRRPTSSRKRHRSVAALSAGHAAQTRSNTGWRGRTWWTKIEHRPLGLTGSVADRRRGDAAAGESSAPAVRRSWRCFWTSHAEV